MESEKWNSTRAAAGSIAFLAGSEFVTKPTKSEFVASAWSFRS